jgi:TRAP-type C4-dicarboxylate transport system permease small subunit
MYESRHQPLLGRREFAHRLARNFAIGLVLIVCALALGTIGYHGVAGLEWIDAFHNSAMILTGMGPIAPMTTTGAKIFASLYALFSGIAFLGMVTVLLAPIAHRVLHKFHIEDKG